MRRLAEDDTAKQVTNSGEVELVQVGQYDQKQQHVEAVDSIDSVKPRQQQSQVGAVSSSQQTPVRQQPHVEAVHIQEILQKQGNLEQEVPHLAPTHIGGSSGLIRRQDPQDRASCAADVIAVQQTVDEKNVRAQSPPLDQPRERPATAAGKGSSSSRSLQGYARVDTSSVQGRRLSFLNSQEALLASSQPANEAREKWEQLEVANDKKPGIAGHAADGCQDEKMPHHAVNHIPKIGDAEEGDNIRDSRIGASLGRNLTSQGEGVSLEKVRHQVAPGDEAEVLMDAGAVLESLSQHKEDAKVGKLYRNLNALQ